MRKITALFLSLLMLAIPAMSLADTGSALIFTGKVESKETTTLYAPFGGTFEDYTLRVGDRVHEGDILVSLDTIKVYAPCDGVVGGIFAQVGDSASFVQNRYGALCYIEPTESLVINTSTAQGHDSAENRFLHIGETVYLRCTTNSNRSGMGRLIAVNGQSYSVEVLEGDLWVGDSVNIHRDEDYTASARIGRGVVSRVNPLAVSGDGAVLSIAVSEGDTVQRGDLLFEMVSGSLDEMQAISPVLTAPVDGIIASISANAGQSVSKNQAILTLHRFDRLQLVSAVSEIDVPLVSVGDQVSIEFDSISGKRYAGVITAVSGIGTLSDSYTEYAVYIEFTPDDDVRLGMSATAYPIN